MKRWRIGIIGCGWAGDRHAWAMRALGERVEIAGVAGRRAEVAQAKAREWQAPFWTDDWRELLAREGLDAVSICLPHDLHGEVAVAALQAGRHVLIEKPLASTLAEADAMISAADQGGLCLMVAENARYDATNIRAAELLRSGAVGDIFLVRIAREHEMHDYLRQRPWFLRDRSGGIMYSGGIHDYELLRMLAGEIEHVYGLAGRKVLPEMVGDDTSVALVGLESDAVATIVESFSLKTPERGVHATVHGSLGSLWLHRDRIRLYRAPAAGQPLAVEEITVAQHDTFQAEMTHFLDCLDGGGEPITSGREERKPLVAVLATYESMARGQRVTLAEFERGQRG